MPSVDLAISHQNNCKTKHVLKLPLKTIELECNNHHYNIYASYPKSIQNILSTWAKDKT